jgi:hypothetical protein
MILLELYQPAPAGYQEVSQDNSQPRLGDLRKSKLTLRQINRLRQINDIRQFEFKENLKLIQKQYAPPPQPAI